MACKVLHAHQNCGHTSNTIRPTRTLCIYFYHDSRGVDKICLGAVALEDLGLRASQGSAIGQVTESRFQELDTKKWLQAR
jgi:hypothetical protein